MLDAVVISDNSGNWTEKPCYYLTVADGVVEVRAHDEDRAGEAEPATAEPLGTA